MARAATSIAGANRVQRYASMEVETFAVERGRIANKEWMRLRASWASTSHAEEDGRSLSLADISSLYERAMSRCVELCEESHSHTLDEQNCFQFQICLVHVLNALIVPQRTSFFSSLRVGKNLSFTGDSAASMKWRYTAMESQDGDRKNMQNSTDYRFESCCDLLVPSLTLLAGL